MSIPLVDCPTGTGTFGLNLIGCFGFSNSIDESPLLIPSLLFSTSIVDGTLNRSAAAGDDDDATSCGLGDRRTALRCDTGGI